MDRPERRPSVRTAVVAETVRGLLGPSPREVLDVGGGTGGFAVRLAELGHRVTVVDPSPDALATLGRRAQESDVHDRVSGVQGDLDSLLGLVGEDAADLVLCHGVLGILDDPAAGLATLARVLRPDGVLSLLVAQRHAAVLGRAMAGHFRQAAALLDGDDEAGEHRFTPDELDALLAPHFGRRELHAVRVFADLVPGSLLDLEPGATAALLDLERAVASRPEYLPLAGQVHAVARV